MSERNVGYLSAMAVAMPTDTCRTRTHAHDTQPPVRCQPRHMIIGGPTVVITLLICWSCLIQVSRGVLVRADRLPVASAQNVANELSCLHASKRNKKTYN
jgi:hypothetical protein